MQCTCNCYSVSTATHLSFLNSIKWAVHSLKWRRMQIAIYAFIFIEWTMKWYALKARRKTKKRKSSVINSIVFVVTVGSTKKKEEKKNEKQAEVRVSMHIVTCHTHKCYGKRHRNGPVKRMSRNKFQFFLFSVCRFRAFFHSLRLVAFAGCPLCLIISGFIGRKSFLFFPLLKSTSFQITIGNQAEIAATTTTKNVCNSWLHHNERCNRLNRFAVHR